MRLIIFGNLINKSSVFSEWNNFLWAYFLTMSSWQCCEIFWRLYSYYLRNPTSYLDHRNKLSCIPLKKLTLKIENLNWISNFCTTFKLKIPSRLAGSSSKSLNQTLYSSKFSKLKGFLTISNFSSRVDWLRALALLLIAKYALM